jgi:catechol 2,3-dioxygenase-like lactoylglutathione lyase family enzyme
MTTPSLGYVIVYVPSVAASLAFYEQAFGLSRRFLHESGSYGELETGATALAFVDETFTPTHGQFALNRRSAPAAGVEVGLVVSDVDAVFARAVSAGAAPAVEPITKPWGQRIAYVRDPDGFLVELCTAMG